MGSKYYVCFHVRGTLNRGVQVLPIGPSVSYAIQTS